jgi:hypothetical protein
LQPNGGYQVYESCQFNVAGTGANGFIQLGNDQNAAGTSRLEWKDCSCSFGAANHGLCILQGEFVWSGGSLGAGVALPATLIKQIATDRGGRATIRGVDLSLLGSGKNLVDAAGLSRDTSVFFENCTLGSSVSVTTGSFAGPGPSVTLVNCDSADTNYRYHFQNYCGTITHETTIVRTGGASDGTTSFSRKMVSSANTKFYAPLASPWSTFWNSTIGSAVTGSFHVVTDNVTLTDAEAWIEIEYMGTSGFPLSLFSSDRAADILATPANQTTSSETWTTTGLTTPVKQVLSKSVTPQEVGWYRARVMLAKPSTTVYVCPKLEIS